MEENLDLPVNENQRPKRLKVLCILTYISTGLSIFTIILRLLLGAPSDEAKMEEKIQLTKAADAMRSLEVEWAANFYEQTMKMNDSLNNSFYSASMFSLLVVVLGLFSALQMWQGKKIGFHLYIIYSLLAVAQTYLFVDPSYIPMFAVVVNLMVAGLFVLMYSRSLNWMK